MRLHHLHAPRIAELVHHHVWHSAKLHQVHHHRRLRCTRNTATTTTTGSSWSRNRPCHSTHLPQLHCLVLLRRWLVVFRVRLVAVLLSLVLPNVVRWDALHAVDFDVNVGAIGQRVGHLVDGLLVHLHAVDGESRASVQFLMADVAFEVLRLLVLHQDLVVVELAVAVPRLSRWVKENTTFRKEENFRKICQGCVKEKGDGVDFVF